MSPRFKAASQLKRRLETSDADLSDKTAFLWIVCLALVSVAARNFEDGLSLDAPLYASIARNIAKTGEWFFMYGNVPDFVPFTEHTHFGFWLQAIIFKILPAADWSARILGHLSYLVNLFLIYKISSHYFNKVAAIIAVLLLWSWPVFSNFHSTFYLDGPTLSFGLGFLVSYYHCFRSRHASTWAIASGILLGCAILTKGLTFLAFGPSAVFVFFLGLSTRFTRTDKKIFAKRCALSAIALVTTSIVLGLYYWGIKNSLVPNFIELYNQRQFAGRFQQSWNWSLIFNPVFWGRLARDTNQLLWLLPLALFSIRRLVPTWLIACFFLTIILMYSPAQRVGGQYWLLAMPPIAILLGAGLASTTLGSKIRPKSWTSFTQKGAIAIALVLQYLPYRTHVSRYPDLTPYTDKLKAAGSINHLLVSGPKDALTFITLGPFGWYPDLPVNYLKEDSLLAYPAQHQPIELVEQADSNPFKVQNPSSAIFHFTEAGPESKILDPELVEFDAVTPTGKAVTYCLIQRIGKSSLFVPKTSTKPYSCVR